LYSHTIPVAPAGSVVVPPPLIPTALGSAEVPSAAETVLPEGHEEDAVVVVMVGAAVGGAVAFADAVGVEAELELAAGDALPQAASAAAAAKAARGIQYELLRVTCDASVIWFMSTPPAGAL
jgi:hypothetical protein